MALLETLDTKAGAVWFSRLMANLMLIGRNFAKLEPGVTDSGAADYAPTLTDRAITRSRATAQTLTLPANATVAIPIGTRIPITVTGAGTLTFQAGAGATITKLAAKGLTVLEGGTVVAIKISTNGWAISGDLG